MHTCNETDNSPHDGLDSTAIHSLSGCTWPYCYWVFAGYTLGTYWVLTGYLLGTYWVLILPTLPYWVLTGYLHCIHCLTGYFWILTGHLHCLHCLTGYLLGTYWVLTGYLLGTYWVLTLPYWVLTGYLLGTYTAYTAYAAFLGTYRVLTLPLLLLPWVCYQACFLTLLGQGLFTLFTHIP